MASIVFDARDVLRKLGALSGGLKNMEELFRNIADLELSQTSLRFRDGEAPDGSKWRDPISIRRDAGGSSFTREAAWGYWKASNFHAIPQGWHFFNRGQGDKPMIDTGQLSQSIQRVFGRDYAEVGTNLKYGKYVQALGFTFLGVNKKTEENIEDAYENYIKGFL